MGRAIFISYRRDDTEGEAGRLFDDLVRAYGDKSVFMDVAGINPGMDFRKAIDDNVATCGVLLAIVGPAWATIANEDGKRRLDDDNDFVRLEIASALARDIPVIPVLVHNARIPSPDHLPENLKNLAYRNSVELTHARWNSDVALLTKALEPYVAASSATSTETIHATIPVQLPPANPPEPQDSAAAKSKMPLFAGIAAVVVVAILAGVFFVAHSSGGGTKVPNGVVPAATMGDATAAVASAAPLAGVWDNPATVERNGLKKLDISVQGNQVSVHAWAQCPGSDCDWGVQPATFDGRKATASWGVDLQTGKRRTATVTMTPVNDGLQVSIANNFSAGGSNQKQMDFVRGQ